MVWTRPPRVCAPTWAAARGVNGAAKTVIADGGTAYGAYATAADTNTTAVGFRALASYSGSVAIGYQARAVADPTVAVGANSLASGTNGVALGASASAQGTDTTSVGYAASATGNNSVALGANASATGNNSVALGNNAIASEDNVVSVGSSGHERRVTNVAPGIKDTDAVNMSQLRSLQSDLQGQIGQTARYAYSGVAMSMAMAGQVMPNMAPGEQGVGVGLGNYRGYTAVAFNYRALTKNGMAFGLGVAASKDGVATSASVGWKW